MGQLIELGVARNPEGVKNTLREVNSTQTASNVTPIGYLVLIRNVKFRGIKIKEGSSLITLDIAYPNWIVDLLLEDDDVVARAQYLIADEIVFSSLSRPIRAFITEVVLMARDEENATLRITLEVYRNVLHQIQHNAIKGEFVCTLHLGAKTRSFNKEEML